MSKEKIVEAVYNKLPYPYQITDLDLSSRKEAIEFTWRGDRIVVNERLHAEIADNGFLISTNTAILITKLLGGC